MTSADHQFKAQGSEALGNAIATRLPQTIDATFRDRSNIAFAARYLLIKGMIQEGWVSSEECPVLPWLVSIIRDGETMATGELCLAATSDDAFEQYAKSAEYSDQEVVNFDKQPPRVVSGSAAYFPNYGKTVIRIERNW